MTDVLRDEQIARLASGRHGLVTAAELRAIGLSKQAIHDRARSGRLHRIHRGVYAVGHRAMNTEQLLQAAVLAVGDDAVLSHLSAAVLWGLVRPSNLDLQRIDVATTRRLNPRRGIRLHLVGALPESDLTSRAGIPVTAAPRTLVDLAGVVAMPILRRAVRQAEVERLADLRAIDAQLGLAACRRGVRQLRELVSAGPAPTRSVLEDRTLDLLRRHGFPRPLINATVRTADRRYEVDFLFPERKLIVEADGERYHAGHAARVNDAAKQAALETAGYRVVRLTWSQVVHQQAQTAERLRRIFEGPAA